MSMGSGNQAGDFERGAVPSAKEQLLTVVMPKEI